MASTGRELLGEHYGQDHLTYEEIEGLGLRVVTEDGRTLDSEDLRGKIFRIVDRDEPSGYVVGAWRARGRARFSATCRLPRSCPRSADGREPGDE